MFYYTVGAGAGVSVPGIAGSTGAPGIGAGPVPGSGVTGGIPPGIGSGIPVGSAGVVGSGIPAGIPVGAGVIAGSATGAVPVVVFGSIDKSPPFFSSLSLCKPNKINNK